MQLYISQPGQEKVFDPHHLFRFTAYQLAREPQARFSHEWVADEFESGKAARIEGCGGRRERCAGPTARTGRFPVILVVCC